MAWKVMYCENYPQKNVKLFFEKNNDNLSNMDFFLNLFSSMGTAFPRIATILRI